MTFGSKPLSGRAPPARTLHRRRLKPVCLAVGLRAVSPRSVDSRCLRAHSGSARYPDARCVWQVRADWVAMVK